MVVAAKLRRCNSSSMSCRSWFTENPPSLRTKLSRQPQMLVWEHAEASAAAAASFKSARIHQSMFGDAPPNAEQGSWAMSVRILWATPMQSDESQDGNYQW